MCLCRRLWGRGRQLNGFSYSFREVGQLGQAYCQAHFLHREPPVEGDWLTFAV